MDTHFSSLLDKAPFNRQPYISVDMKKKFEQIILHLTSSSEGIEPLSGIDITGQFRPEEEAVSAVARNLNAAFLISLAGDLHPLYNQAMKYLSDHEQHPSWKNAVSFYKDGLTLIHSEIADKCYATEGLQEKINRLYSVVMNPEDRSSCSETINALRQVFFPEGVSLDQEREEKISRLREKRKITITRLNERPIENPASEILFTSNILLTVPSPDKSIDDLPINYSLKRALKQVVAENQLFWYDHPVHIGTDRENNEVIYGLKGLDNTVEFEKQRGTIKEGDRLNCVLSVSVTHEGIQSIAKEYLQEELKREQDIHHLNLFIFTEADTSRLIDEILSPAVSEYIGADTRGLFYEIFGVDGEYGRHYTFLKAVSAFWQVFIDPEIRGTFKIDLDQVFPQKELVQQSGASAFEHLKTPLWGAEGIDFRGEKIELGMLAGALVNQKDIRISLFRPDVKFPTGEIKGDEVIFFSRLPQALSTEAEMMTRYHDGDLLNGKDHCIQRIHVTGGTNGILIESLRRYRPFTPAFIARAEDQAYILSVLFKDTDKNLRYLHKDGLIMRHDKEAFAGEAIEAAALGKIIGDYVRILLTSYYVEALPWPLKKTKETIDPFTGCFVSHIPFTVVYLRLALKTATFFSEGGKEKNQKGLEFSQLGTKRLHGLINELAKGQNPPEKRYRREKEGWDIFYEVLDRVEKGIQQGEEFALELQKKAMNLIKECNLEVGQN